MPAWLSRSRSWRKQQLQLADQLTTARETTLAHVTGDESRQTATTTAEAQGGQARQTAEFDNKLPPTAAQQAANDIAKDTLVETKRKNIEEESRPIPGGFSSTFVVKDPTAQSGWKVVSAIADNKPMDADPNSNNLPAQIGLSDGAVKQLSGQTAGMRMNAAQSAKIQKEITDWGIKTGINTSTIKAQANAINKNIEFNLTRNNAANVLDKEIAGTIDNAKEFADAIKGAGKIAFVNGIAVWAGKQDNDPNAIKLADQLGRLRQEVAGYNAVAGGALLENGTPRIGPQDEKNAEALISNGISSGGLQALADSVTSSAAKNRLVLLDAIDDTNDQFYKLFGATYHPPKRNDALLNAAGAARPGAAPPPAAPPAAPGGAAQPAPAAPPPAPKGIDPTVWLHMTPEERKLFQ
jgi:hypothetical protein